MSIPARQKPEITEPATSSSDPAVTATPPTNAGPSDLGQELIRWRSHPAKTGGTRLIWVVAIAVGTPTVLAVLYGPFYGFLGLVILGGSLGTYFLPTEYVMYQDGLESRFLGVRRRFRWEQFRSFYRDRHGVLLSPFPRPSRLENFRGLYVRFGSQTDGVMAIVSDKLQQPNVPDAGDGAASVSREVKP